MAGKYQSIAYDMLKDAGQPLNTEEISDIATDSGRLTENDGKTPEASISAAIYINIKGGRNGKDKIVFTKLGPNLFGLVEWDYVHAFIALKQLNMAAKRLHLGNY